MLLPFLFYLTVRFILLAVTRWLPILAAPRKSFEDAEGLLNNLILISALMLAFAVQLLTCNPARTTPDAAELTRAVLRRWAQNRYVPVSSGWGAPSQPLVMALYSALRTQGSTATPQHAP